MSDNQLFKPEERIELQRVLSKMNREQLLVIVSTHGEGEPPLAAQELYEKLKSGRGISAENIRYLVIALGDSTYKHFCKTGHDFFEFLKKLGASPLRDVVELDTDFNTRLSGLIPEVVGQFATANAAQSAQSSRPAAAKDVEVDIQDGPVEVEIIEKIQLNGRGADKETWHIELVAEHPALKYQPGDAIEVFTENDPSLVAAVLDTVGLDGRCKTDQ